MVKEVLIIQNSNSFPVAFKVKTTTPRQYCVRPNAGRIEPGETVDVQVVLQPMREDPPPDFRCRDKFLVQSVAIPAEHNHLPVAELWPVIEREKAEVHERKLRCSFLMPAGGQDDAGQAAAAAASANGEDASLLAGDTSTYNNASVS
ncbi:PapD-like protein [Syncephalis plumigaleata]|nr:PapD-like protein [Syncephalis plumigaleata]